jgi:acyl carrier protein
MGELREKLKLEIISRLNLEGIQPSDIRDDEPLFGPTLGLDSIDALELIVLLEKDYGVKIENPEEGKKIFQSVDSMAQFIEHNQS